MGYARLQAARNVPRLDFGGEKYVDVVLTITEV